MRRDPHASSSLTGEFNQRLDEQFLTLTMRWCSQTPFPCYDSSESLGLAYRTHLSFVGLESIQILLAKMGFFGRLSLARFSPPEFLNWVFFLRKILGILPELFL